MNGTTKQRYFSTTFWSDEWIDSLTPIEKLIYINLLTNAYTNAAGVYPYALKYCCTDTGCSRDEVNNAIKKFEAAGKAFHYREYMIIPKWLKHQKIKERSGLWLGAVKVLKSLPDYIKDFISDHRHYDYDISDIIERVSRPSLDPVETLPLEMGDPPYENDRPSAETPLNLAHDLDSDLDSDLDGEFDIEINNTTDTEKPKPTPKPKKPPIREREPENDHEKVEKVYLLNWDSLFSQNKVKTANPIVNWNQTRALLKNHFKTLTPEQIIKAVNNGMSDDFVLQGGYSLATMLSSSVLNRLINSEGRTGQKHRIANDYVDKDDISTYFTEA